MPRRRVLLVQLPIPQPGLDPARGNVPLAAAYLALYARHRGLDPAYDVEVLSAATTNRCGNRALVAEILARDPWMVGFTCYLWNVERTLAVAEEVKRLRPATQIVLGGPEITADNDWVLEHPAVDWAALGEGEQTFADLLEALRDSPHLPATPIPGLWRRGHATPPFRTPLAKLDVISSPYLAGLLDAADEQMLLLETIRGCIFKCKFCFYPKSYDDLYFLSEERIVANLRHASERGAREVILLDPTLNQRRDFAGFLRLLAACNPEQRFTYFGELRAEGIDAEIARLLREANFTEVEIGLQSTDPVAQKLMDRRNNMRAFERGVGAMLDAGIRVKIDFIVGLPGDTPESVRSGMRWLQQSGLYSDVQVFNLAVLPGTAFREEAAALGLRYQPRPPYYVLQTPTMDLHAMHALMAEAEELFDLEFDAVPPPRLAVPAPVPGGLACEWRVDLDAPAYGAAPVLHTQAFPLWIRGRDLDARGEQCAALVDAILGVDPHTTLQVVLEPAGGAMPGPAAVALVLEACYRRPTYLDRFYAVMPGIPKGSKRVVIALPASARTPEHEPWIESVTEQAAILWRGTLDESELLDQEFVAAE